jgi:predicted AlkP superfamily pyrophosphatase or phosphodiesterase
MLGAALPKHVVLITVDGFPAYLFHDSKLAIPRLRRLATEGVSAEGMRVINPTATWPNHTTLVTGVRPEKHSVLFNGLVVLGTNGGPVSVAPDRTKADLVAVPTLYDLLHAQGRSTAAIDWPCTSEAKTLEDDFPDAPNNVLHTSARLKTELVASHVLSDDKDESFGKMTGPGRDEVWTRAACLVIEKRKPSLTIIHLLNTDGTHHRYGPQSPASYTALELADSYVGRILDSLKTAGIDRDTAVIVTADHGFASATNVIQPNVLLRQAGLIEVGSFGRITKARVQVIPDGGIGVVYFNDPATYQADLQKVLELFKDREGVADLIETNRFPEYGLPLPSLNPRMGQLIICAKDGYGLNGSFLGEQYVVPVSGTINVGYHGYISTNPKMNAFFVAAGKGIKRGARIGMIDNVDVAPTIAHLLGVKLEQADGQVLKDILVE